MMRFALLLALLCACAPTLPDVATLPIHPGKARCNAVAVAPSLAVTVAHCAAGLDVVNADAVLDVAVVRLAVPVDRWATLDTTPLAVGDAVCGTCYRQGWARQACGHVDAVMPLPAYRVTIRPPPGASGSGLWTLAGKLAGICQGRELDTGLGLYISSARIREVWSDG